MSLPDQDSGNTKSGTSKPARVSFPSVSQSQFLLCGGFWFRPKEGLTVQKQMIRLFSLAFSIPPRMLSRSISALPTTLLGCRVPGSVVNSHCPFIQPAQHFVKPKTLFCSAELESLVYPSIWIIYENIKEGRPQRGPRGSLQVHFVLSLSRFTRHGLGL